MLAPEVDIQSDRLLLDQKVGKHSHDYVVLAFVARGHAQHLSELGSTRLGPGGVMLLGVGAWHSYAPQHQLGVSVLRIGRPVLEGALSWLADLDVIGSVFDLAGSDLDRKVMLGQLDPFSAAIVGPALSDLIQSSSGRRSSFLYRLGKLCEILHCIDDFWEQALTSPRPGATRQRRRNMRPESQKAAALMQSRLNSVVSIDAIAREIGLSTSQLERVFAADFGISPTAYLVNTRLSEFSRLLRETRISVSEAALAVGWRSASHAGHLFRQRTGLTPSRYREEHAVHRL